MNFDVETEIRQKASAYWEEQSAKNKRKASKSSAHDENDTELN